MKQGLRTMVLPALAALALAANSAYAQQESGAFEPPPPPPDPELEPVPEAAEPPSVQPDRRSFDEELKPYGRWVVTPDYGQVWVPSVEAEWQPYADGRWVSTTWGWSFVAPVPWGRVVYHYGRWGWRAGFGWFWVPAYVWGPAWVSWRWVNGYACWAPLAPAGFVYGPYWRGWVVVPYSRFTSPIRVYKVPRPRVSVIVRSARPVRAFPTWHARHFNVRPGVRVHGRGHRH